MIAGLADCLIVARPRLYDDALRDSLIAAAIETISESGIEGLALRSLAADCDTTTNALYTLFGSKDALVRAALNHALQDFMESLEATPPRATPAEDLKGLQETHRTWARARPRLYMAMFGRTAGRWSDGDQRAESEFSWAEARTRQLMARVAGGGAGRARAEDDMFLAATSIWMVMHAVVAMELTGRSWLGPDQMERLQQAQIDMTADYWL